MKRFLSLLIVAAATAALLLVPAAKKASVAEAGPLCTYSAGIICGRITNNSPVGIGLIPNWGPDSQNGYGGGWYQAILPPGWNSSSFYQDTDGIYIGACWVGQVQVLYRYGWATISTFNGPRNYKIRDANVYRVNSWQRC